MSRWIIVATAVDAESAGVRTLADLECDEKEAAEELLDMVNTYEGGVSEVARREVFAFTERSYLVRISGHKSQAEHFIRMAELVSDTDRSPEETAASPEAGSPGSAPWFAPAPVADVEPLLPAGLEMVEPYGGGTGFRFKIRNVTIDGHDDVAFVRGGGSHEVRFDLLHDCSECGNAINQVIVGLAGEDRAQASVWNGKQRSGGELKVVNPGTSVAAAAEDNPGPAEWVNVSCDIVVPDEPGTYSIRARYSQAYQGRVMTAEGREVPQSESQDALGWWKVDRPDGPGPESTIGTIVVEP
ncbi:hypothetical protein EES43_23615 [Streptomyces sp. ADI96-02]|uniref:hypothetical protein n=1 Tax=unclassified Streptomyces TaxID=2593676 RepID=UPI000F998294|nr:hypothetical protein [Streptomyces sp. ADI96-02]RPK56813.1 hypothetical protein EES43_23615 [Streptomyces sp. ADI96-02]